MHFNINKIVQSSLCLGCGFCEAVGGRYGIKMHLSDNGFYEPNANNLMPKELQIELSTICPGIHVDCIDTSDTFYGDIKAVYEGWSLNPIFRKAGSSGGIITTLAIHLLNTKQITGVLQVGVKEGDYLNNELKISRTEEDVLACSSSRYAPSLMFDHIIDILNMPQEKFLFIGKPCDVMSLRQYVELHLEYKDTIKYFVSLVCAGMPSYNATQKLINKADNQSVPISLKYRGDGWPGDFKVVFDNGKQFSCSYNDSWGTVLGRDVKFRCKICPDGLGQYADIVVGDAWHTLDGYPDFSEKDGQSFILVRNELGLNLIEESYDASEIMLTTLDVDNLRYMQPYQYQRLKTNFYKLLPAYVVTGGILKIRRLKISKFSFIRGCRVGLGTVYRFYKKKS